jgi:hypothetical protein
MEHAEALERIELAAVEPDGLERLMAGDTPESGAVAGHLAGCPSCVAELARIRRVAALAREAITSAPDPALRERTLAFVREVGVDRPAATAAPRAEPGFVSEPAVMGPVIVPAAGSAAASSVAPRRRLGWKAVAGLAAALVVGIGVGAGVAISRSPAPQLAEEVEVLQATTETTLRVESQPDARRIPLTATGTAPGAAGTLVYSPSTGELVMVATGLGALPEGDEYGCWIEADGQRTRIGKMYPGGDLQAWAGWVEGLEALPEDAAFGVSLVPADGSESKAVLTGGG